MAPSGGPRLSGLQKQVLSLYRGFLRAARLKSLEDRKKIESLVSAEFRRNAMQIDHKNFLHIEYLLRRGKKQLDQLKSPCTIGLSSINVTLPQTQQTKPWNMVGMKVGLIFWVELYHVLSIMLMVPANYQLIPIFWKQKEKITSKQEIYSLILFFYLLIPFLIGSFEENNWSIYMFNKVYCLLFFLDIWNVLNWTSNCC